MKKKNLEMILETIPVHPNPKLHLEQYSISGNIAAEILFIADSMFNDIRFKNIAELGCGTGRLSIGAALLGALKVVAVDLDRESIYILQKKLNELNVRKIQTIVSDIETIKGNFDTVLQNPPFGIKSRGADRPFILKALEISKVAYSLHKADIEGRYFIKRLVERNNGKITHIFTMQMKIPWIFPFHRKKIYKFNVDLYRLTGHA